jgi:hypothetical protein
MSLDKNTPTTPFANLAELEHHFNGIVSRLETMSGKLKDGTPEKAQFEAHTNTAKLLRHQVLGTVAGRLGSFETKQAGKILAPTTAAA